MKMEPVAMSLKISRINFGNPNNYGRERNKF